jgi:D-alanyl-D-alanine carboxypeptidase
MIKKKIKAAAVLILAVGFLISLTDCSERKFENLNQELAHHVSAMVKDGGTIRDCVVSVIKGDGSFSWSGAAGIASQNSQAPMTNDTPIYIASITKLYTATVIMRLVENRALSLDDFISKYLPEKLIQGLHVYQGKDYSKEITIKQLLSHTSGIADYYDEKPKGGKSVFELLLENPERLWTPDETIERAKDLSPNFQPGTDASYSDTNFQLLGKIIEAVSGKPLHIAYEEFIFRPLKLKQTYLIGHPEGPGKPRAPADVFYKDKNITRIRANTAYWADGGIVSTTEEMITFLKALNEGRLIKKDTLNTMHNWHKLRFPLQYGYGTMYFKLPKVIHTVTKLPPLWGHSGSTGSFLYYSEDLNLYIAGTVDQVD